MLQYSRLVGITSWGNVSHYVPAAREPTSVAEAVTQRWLRTGSLYRHQGSVKKDTAIFLSNEFMHCLPSLPSLQGLDTRHPNVEKRSVEGGGWTKTKWEEKNEWAPFLRTSQRILRASGVVQKSSGFSGMCLSDSYLRPLNERHLVRHLLCACVWDVGTDVQRVYTGIATLDGR